MKNKKKCLPHVLLLSIIFLSLLFIGRDSQIYFILFLTGRAAEPLAQNYCLKNKFVSSLVRAFKLFGRLSQAGLKKIREREKIFGSCATSEIL